MLLRVRGTPIHELDGEYWTERETKGKVHFQARAGNSSDDFAHAQGQKYKDLLARK